MTSYDADLRLFVDGAWRFGEGRDAQVVLNPATGAAIAEVPLATAADLANFAQAGVDLLVFDTKDV